MDKVPPDPFEEKTTATIAEAFDVMVEASGMVYQNATFLNRVVRSFYIKALKPMMYLVVAVIISQGLQWFSLIQRDDKVDAIKETIEVVDNDVKEMQKAAEAARVASENAQKASAEAKLASEAAKKSLDEAIAQSQRGGVSPEVIQALERINVIYEACRTRGECR